MTNCKYRVLLVDDDRGLLRLLSMRLTAAGYLVEAVEGGEQALAMVRAKIYDAAILDFNLPDMDGVILHR